MKVIVEEAAAADLDDAIEWISKDSPRAAAKMRRRIVARINRLADARLSEMGRPGQIPNTRELLILPYIVVYTVENATGRVLVRSIMHGARERRAFGDADDQQHYFGRKSRYGV